MQHLALTDLLGMLEASTVVLAAGVTALVLAELALVLSILVASTSRDRRPW